MKVLALSGSLRVASVNSALLRAAARLAPTGITVQVQAGLGALPLFNPDLESQPPDAIAQLRTAVADADALIIASPEYAHGIAAYTILRSQGVALGKEQFDGFHAYPPSTPLT